MSPPLLLELTGPSNPSGECLHSVSSPVVLPADDAIAVESELRFLLVEPLPQYVRAPVVRWCTMFSRTAIFGTFRRLSGSHHQDALRLIYELHTALHSGGRNAAFGTNGH
jgi:hypothetical protein